MPSQFKPTNDPATYNLVKVILDRLFIAETRRLQKQIQNLVLRNQEAGKHSRQSFMYEGKSYRAQTNQNVIDLGSRTLDLSLWSDMQAWLKDRDTIKLDRDLIKQLLTKLYDNCGRTGYVLQDLRDATPDCILDTMTPEIRALERTRPVTRLLHHSRDWEQYNELLPKIEFYATVRLIY